MHLCRRQHPLNFASAISSSANQPPLSGKITKYFTISCTHTSTYNKIYKHFSCTICTTHVLYIYYYLLHTILNFSVHRKFVKTLFIYDANRTCSWTAHKKHIMNESVNNIIGCNNLTAMYFYRNMRIQFIYNPHFELYFFICTQIWVLNWKKLYSFPSIYIHISALLSRGVFHNVSYGPKLKYYEIV